MSQQRKEQGAHTALKMQLLRKLKTLDRAGHENLVELMVDRAMRCLQLQFERLSISVRANRLLTAEKCKSEKEVAAMPLVYIWSDLSDLLGPRIDFPADASVWPLASVRAGLGSKAVEWCREVAAVAPASVAVINAVSSNFRDTHCMSFFCSSLSAAPFAPATAPSAGLSKSNVARADGFAAVTECGRPGCRRTAGLTCLGCKSQWYCSKSCQGRDRGRHSSHCRPEFAPTKQVSEPTPSLTPPPRAQQLSEPKQLSAPKQLSGPTPAPAPLPASSLATSPFAGCVPSLPSRPSGPTYPLDHPPLSAYVF